MSIYTYIYVYRPCHMCIDIYTCMYILRWYIYLYIYIYMCMKIIYVNISMYVYRPHIRVSAYMPYI